jgi:hypothetical protein
VPVTGVVATDEGSEVGESVVEVTGPLVGDAGAADGGAPLSALICASIEEMRATTVSYDIPLFIGKTGLALKIGATCKKRRPPRSFVSQSSSESTPNWREAGS